MVVPDLLAHLRASYSPVAPVSYDALFKQMLEADLLLLDDLGAEQSRPWVDEKLYQLLNYRYNARLPLVVTTNRMGLLGIEPRIRSRLSDRLLASHITMAQAQDYRLQGSGEVPP
jgi:DNA replication protein DnaC